MDKRSVVAVVLGVVSVACATGVLEPSTPQPAPYIEKFEPGSGARVAGIVRDQDSERSIAGALVILQCTCLQGARETTTDAAGLYVFRNLPPGKYTVQVLFNDANVNKTFELPPETAMRVHFRIDPDKRFMIT